MHTLYYTAEVETTLNINKTCADILSHPTSWHACA